MSVGHRPVCQCIGFESIGGTRINLRTTRCVRALPISHPPPSAQLVKQQFYWFPVLSPAKKIRDHLDLELEIVLDDHSSDLLMVFSSSLPQATTYEISFSIWFHSPLSIVVVFSMPSNRQTKQQGKRIPDSGPQYVFDRLPSFHPLPSCEFRLISV